MTSRFERRLALIEKLQRPVSAPPPDPEPCRILHRQRLVEAINGPHLLDQFRGGIGRQDGVKRVTRRDMNEKKAEDADADRHRRDEEEPLERVQQHRNFATPMRKSRPRAAPARIGSLTTATTVLG
jgi:hypothetical protein